MLDFGCQKFTARTFFPLHSLCCFTYLLGKKEFSITLLRKHGFFFFFFFLMPVCPKGHRSSQPRSKRCSCVPTLAPSVCWSCLLALAHAHR